MIINEHFLVLQRSQLTSGLTATRDTRDRLHHMQIYMRFNDEHNVDSASRNFEDCSVPP